MDRTAEYLRVAEEAGKECLAAALDYLALGWPALALCPPDHLGVGRNHGRECESPGKRPWHYWTDFYDRLPTTDEVEQWWKDNIMSNVGVAMGPVSKLVGLDPDGPSGEAKLQEMSGGDLPKTLEFSTPGGGRRLLYAIPDGAIYRPTYLQLGKKEELRFLGYGAQTVMPPSRHINLGRYVWRDGHGPTEIAAALAPKWLTEFLSAPSAAASGQPRTLADGELILEGNRNGFLTSLAGTMRSRGFGQEAIIAALTVENGDRCDPPLPQHEVETIARSVSRYPAGSPDTLFTRGQTKDVGFSLGLTVMSDLSPQPLRWLVPSYLPLGKLVLLAGNGGHGKSTVTLDIAAALSVGRRPFGTAIDRTEPCSTLLVSCEDDYEDTILPRLMSAGADLSRIFRVDGVKDKDGKLAPFSLVHYEAIEAELSRRPDVRLIVVDPAGAFVGRSGIDDHKDSELRALLGPLTELAARRGVTIIIVKHLSKGTTAKAVDKVGGSTGYVNAVRAAFLIAPDPQDEAKKLFMPIKFNLGPKPPAMAYRLASLDSEGQNRILSSCTHLGDEDKTRLALQLFHVDWMGVVEADPDQIMAGPNREEKSDRAERKCDEAANWIAEFLAAGPKPSEEVIAAGAKRNFGRGTMFKAKKTAGIKARKCAEGWEWLVPTPSHDPTAEQEIKEEEKSEDLNGQTPFDLS